MRAKRNTPERLIEQAFEVFRTYGYEGTSFSRLAAALGIEKATLYYHFPGGKEQIAEAVATQVSAWFTAQVFERLGSREGTPLERLQAVVGELRTMYGDGHRPCVLDTLSLRGGSSRLAESLRSSLLAWLAAFSRLVQETGQSRAVANRRAEQAIAHIEGALVLSRVLGETKPFLRALADLPAQLLDG